MKNKDRNLIFFAGCCISAIILLFPLLLRIESMRMFVSFLFQPLKSSDYKVMYVGVFGGLLGTFLAISGTLWAQKHIDNKASQARIQKSANMLYYELSAAIYNVLNLYCYYERNVYDVAIKQFDACTFRKGAKLIRVDVSNAWNEWMAILSDCYSDSDIKKLHNIYESLLYIKMAIDSDVNEVPDELLAGAYVHVKGFCKTYSNYDGKLSYTTNLKPEVQDILEKTRKIAKIS